MNKYICEACKSPCKITVSGNSDAPKHCPYNMIWKAVNWHKVDEEQTVTDCNQLPKLTVEVFDRPDCPEWAQYAAFYNGNLVFTDQKPWINEHGLFVSANKAARIEKILTIPFKSNEHYFSQVIKRPAKKSELPDWCKVGEWVYNTVYKEYVQISDIDEFEVSLKDGAYCSMGIKSFLEDCRQARLRPWNFEEAPYQLKVKRNDRSGAREELTFLSPRSGEWGYLVGAYDNECFTFYSFEEMKILYRTLDGEPCGVLEHLENGEWVE